MRDDFGDALRLVDLRYPLGERAEHPAVVDLLERIATSVLVRDLADEEQQRRAVLHRHVHADRAMAGARTTCHHRRRGTAFEFAKCFGHMHRAGLEATGDQLQFLPDLIESVEHIEIALAWHGKYMIDALRHQGIRKRAPTRPWDDARLARLSQFHPGLLVAPPGRLLTGKSDRATSVTPDPDGTVEWTVRTNPIRKFRIVVRSLDSVCSPQIGQNVRQFPPLPVPTL